MPTDTTKTSRAPSRSPSQPATGIATATATRYPMLMVAVASTGTPSSSAMVGKRHVDDGRIDDVDEHRDDEDQRHGILGTHPAIMAARRRRTFTTRTFTTRTS